ncbi:MAG: ABC transporter ATP-binding protein [Promethearchaeota archaeon]
MENNTSLDYAIETYNLTKKYKIRGKDKEILALNNINLKVKNGEIFGLLGPNGAGKTTLISILTTLIQPTFGSAKILNKDILRNKRFVKENVGLMLGGDMIYYRLTGYKNLNFFCKLYGIKNPKKRINIVAEKLGLVNWLNQYVENYSTGMKVKLALARVLITDPKIMFLDEPMLGLDPNIVKDLIGILLNFKKTIFLTSHQMNVVESVCDRVAFLREGEIIKVDTKENFKRLIKENVKILVNLASEKEQEFIDKLSTLEYVKDIYREKKDIFLELKNQFFYSQLLKIISDYPISKLKEVEANLDDVFIRLSI